MKSDAVSAVILAAGDGKRLKSARPKVIHNAAGRPLLAHVLDACVPLELSARVVVVSPRVDEIRAAVDGAGAGEGVTYVVQDPPRGTADALKVALIAVPPGDALLVLAGDIPMVDPPELSALIELFHGSGAAAAMLTVEIEDPSGYGRVVRDLDGRVESIVEHRDAAEEQLAIREVNSGIYLFDREHLERMLDKVDDSNTQGEYYLTDVIGLMSREGLDVVARIGPAEILRGVNSRAQLADIEAEMRRRTCLHFMEEGVTIVDPATTYIDSTVEIEPDVTLRPFTFLEGKTRLRSGAEVGPQCRIIDSEIGENAQVSYAVIRESVVGPEATVGPFASLRAGTVLGPRSRAGTFVETKNTTIGEDSKVPHLSYMGDAEIGARANVGAGTITCNWDGQAKHKTTIEDDVYIGSDTMLVAPVHMHKRSASGAGAVVRGDVPEDSLAVGVPARVIEGRGDRMGASVAEPRGEAGGAPEPAGAAGNVTEDADQEEED